MARSTGRSSRSRSPNTEFRTPVRRPRASANCLRVHVPPQAERDGELVLALYESCALVCGRARRRSVVTSRLTVARELSRFAPGGRPPDCESAMKCVQCDKKIGWLKRPVEGSF